VVVAVVVFCVATTIFFGLAKKAMANMTIAATNKFLTNI
jgi:hypothetical protein